MAHASGRVSSCELVSTKCKHVRKVTHSIHAENPADFVPFCAFIRTPPELLRKPARKVVYSFLDFSSSNQLARDAADKEGLGLRNRLATPGILEHKLADGDGIGGVEWQLWHPARWIEDHDECNVNQEFPRVFFRFEAFRTLELIEFESIRSVELGMEGWEAMCTLTTATKKFPGRRNAEAEEKRCRAL